MAEAEGGLLEQVLEAGELVVTLQHSNHARMIPWHPAIEIRLAFGQVAARGK
jgi:hypothetical protein